MRHNRQNYRRQRGAATLEAILVIPILVWVVFAAFEYGMIMLVEQAVTSAALEGAREGALEPSVSIIHPSYWADVQEAVTWAVDDILGVYGMGDLAAPNSGVMVIIEDIDNIACIGDTTVTSCPAATSIVDPMELKVTVWVRFSAARIPNFLSIVGLDLSQRKFHVAGIVQKQQ